MVPILEISDLLIRRGERVVLEIASLEVQEGEVLAVIGPNGAGKSTFLLVVSKLLQPERGRLSYRGRLLGPRDGLAYRRQIGLVLQDPLLIDASVYSNVAAGLRFRRMPKDEIHQRVTRWTEALGIAHLLNRPARSLSGGEAQRVSLARAFALEPDLLLLDEPFSALDAPTRLRLVEDFQALLAGVQLTTIMVTHSMDEALLLGDRVAVFLQGGLRQIGSPEQVFRAPVDPEVAAFVGVDVIIPGKVLSCTGGMAVVAANGYQLDAVGEVTAGRPVYLLLRPEDITVWPDGAAPASSARNRLRGVVTHLLPQGPLVRVGVDCGFPLIALITRSSAEEMGIEPGLPVTVSFKASAVHLIARA